MAHTSTGVGVSVGPFRGRLPGRLHPWSWFLTHIAPDIAESWLGDSAGQSALFLGPFRGHCTDMLWNYKIKVCG